MQTVIVKLTDFEYDVILAEHLINLTTVDSLIIGANLQPPEIIFGYIVNKIN